MTIPSFLIVTLLADEHISHAIMNKSAFDSHETLVNDELSLL